MVPRRWQRVNPVICHFANHHQKTTTRVKDENVDISKMSIHSAAASTTCSLLNGDLSSLMELVHISDDEWREQGTKPSRVVKSSAKDLPSRHSDNNSVDELHKRFLWFQEESSVKSLEKNSSNAPLHRTTYMHLPSEDIMVGYVRELAFLPVLTELTPTKFNYGG